MYTIIEKLYSSYLLFSVGSGSHSPSSSFLLLLVGAVKLLLAAAVVASLSLSLLSRRSLSRLSLVSRSLSLSRSLSRSLSLSRSRSLLSFLWLFPNSPLEFFSLFAWLLWWCLSWCLCPKLLEFLFAFSWKSLVKDWVKTANTEKKYQYHQNHYCFYIVCNHDKNKSKRTKQIKIINKNIIILKNQVLYRKRKITIIHITKNLSIVI